MYLVWRAPCLVCDLLTCADLKTGLFPEEILDSVDETGELVPDWDDELEKVNRDQSVEHRAFSVSVYCNQQTCEIDMWNLTLNYIIIRNKSTWEGNERIDFEVKWKVRRHFTWKDVVFRVTTVRVNTSSKKRLVASLVLLGCEEVAVLARCIALDWNLHDANSLSHNCTLNAIFPDLPHMT